MSANGFRIVALNGLGMLAAAMMLAGFPLILAVGREVYHMPQPIDLPGAAAAWRSAHVVGLTSSLGVLVVAQLTRLKPMALAFERSLIVALAAAGWANTIGAIAVAISGVHGVELDFDVANDIIFATFGVAAVAMLYAVAFAIIHLWRPIEAKHANPPV